METTTKLTDFEKCSKKFFNHYNHVHLFFYTFINDKLNLLLFKKAEDQNFKELNTQVHKADNVPPFALARLMATQLKGLFSKANIKKFEKGENLKKEDISEREEYHAFEIWHLPCFTEWLDFLSESPLIQYDEIKGKMVYFIKFPEIKDLNSLNLNLKEINYNLQFEYFNIENNSNNSNSNNNSNNNIDPNTLQLLNFINYKTFISETQKNIENDNLDYYIVLAIKPASLNKADQAGFFHFPALFQGLYRRNNEKWVYKVCSLELPSLNELKKAKAIIIPGSHFSVYDDYEFIKTTEEFIRNIVSNFKEIKLLGICFGEQLIIQALGGEVKKMKTDFIMYPEKLNFKEEFWSLNFVKLANVEKKDSLIIPQAHGDEVTVIPELKDTKILNFGESNFCKNEILVSEDEKLFLIQGHPEYSPHFNIGRTVPFYMSKRKIEFNTENALKVMEEMRKHEHFEKVDSEDLRKLCYSFLKN